MNIADLDDDAALRAEERRDSSIAATKRAYVRGDIDLDTMERWIDREFGLLDDLWKHWAGVWTRKGKASV